MTEHRHDPTVRAPTAYIFCVCGWSHDSLFAWRNERALKRHIRMWPAEVDTARRTARGARGEGPDVCGDCGRHKNDAIHTRTGEVETDPHCGLSHPHTATTRCPGGGQ